MKQYILLVMACLLSMGLHAQTDKDKLIFKVIQDELERNRELSLPEEGKPFYISFHIISYNHFTITGVLGGITESEESLNRLQGSVNLLLGDYAETSQLAFGGHLKATALPDDMNYKEMRRQIWLLTDQVYKDASFSFSDKKAHKDGYVKKELELDDWTPIQPITKYIHQDKEYSFDKEAWEVKLKKLSDILRSILIYTTRK